MGKNVAILPRHEDVIHICSKLPCVAQFRSEWEYNNWPFALAACLVESQGNDPWHLKIFRILKTLGMHRSFTNNPDDENFARAYKVFNDGCLSEVDRPLLKGGDAFDGSSSLRSCVNDMVIWCKVLMEALKMGPLIEEDDFEAISPIAMASGSPKPPDGLTKRIILRALRAITQPQFPLAKDPRQTYGLGLFSFHLPTYEINTITNPHATEIMKSYVMGADSSPRVVIGHTGDLGSFTNAYWTFLETDSAVIVMTNASSTYGDPSNILAQVSIQALFELQPATNYEELTSRIVADAKAKWQRAIDGWEAERLIGTQPHDLNAYAGTYTSTDLRMTLKISIEEGEPASRRQTALRLAINDVSDQIFHLYHYHLDTWSFLPESHDQCIEMGVGHYLSRWETFNVTFDRLAEGTFQEMTWPLDLDPRAGSQVFCRVGA